MIQTASLRRLPQVMVTTRAASGCLRLQRAATTEERECASATRLIWRTRFPGEPGSAPSRLVEPGSAPFSWSRTRFPGNRVLLMRNPIAPGTGSCQLEEPGSATQKRRFLQKTPTLPCAAVRFLVEACRPRPDVAHRSNPRQPACSLTLPGLLPRHAPVARPRPDARRSTRLLLA